MKFFLDTYALIEIAKNNPNYKNFSLERTSAVTSVLNLMELHFYYIKNFGQKEADRIYGIVRAFVITIDDEIIKEANNFKLLNLKKRLSFADCVGYITAQKFKAKFVTGDYAFKGLESVEFLR